MFKMGCSMARRILGPGSASSHANQDQPGCFSGAQGAAGHEAGGSHNSAQSSKKGGKQQTDGTRTTQVQSSSELNDFSKLEQDPRLPLNVLQIFKITKSWKAIARTMSKTGTAMFLNLFEQNQDLFHLFDRFQHLKGEELHESMELREHAATVMATLDTSINSLSDYDNFVTYLHSIGQLHRKVPGFKREYFWRIEQPFMKAVKQTLDERCNETIEEIYKVAIKLIIETIADGYGFDEPENEASAGDKPDASPRPGQEDGSRRRLSGASNPGGPRPQSGSGGNQISENRGPAAGVKPPSNVRSQKQRQACTRAEHEPNQLPGFKLVSSRFPSTISNLCKRKPKKRSGGLGCGGSGKPERFSEIPLDVDLAKVEPKARHRSSTLGLRLSRPGRFRAANVFPPSEPNPPTMLNLTACGTSLRQDMKPIEGHQGYPIKSGDADLVAAARELLGKTAGLIESDCEANLSGQSSDGPRRLLKLMRWKSLLVNLNSSLERNSPVADVVELPNGGARSSESEAQPPNEASRWSTVQSPSGCVGERIFNALSAALSEARAATVTRGNPLNPSGDWRTEASPAGQAGQRRNGRRLACAVGARSRASGTVPVRNDAKAHGQLLGSGRVCAAAATAEETATIIDSGNSNANSNNRKIGPLAGGGGSGRRGKVIETIANGRSTTSGEGAVAIPFDGPPSGAPVEVAPVRRPTNDVLISAARDPPQAKRHGVRPQAADSASVPSGKLEKVAATRNYKAMASGEWPRGQDEALSDQLDGARFGCLPVGLSQAESSKLLTRRDINEGHCERDFGDFAAAANEYARRQRRRQSSGRPLNSSSASHLQPDTQQIVTLERLESGRVGQDGQRGHASKARVSVGGVGVKRRNNVANLDDGNDRDVVLRAGVRLDNDDGRVADNNAQFVAAYNNANIVHLSEPKRMALIDENETIAARLLNGIAQRERSWALNENGDLIESIKVILLINKLILASASMLPFGKTGSVTATAAATTTIAV